MKAVKSIRIDEDLWQELKEYTLERGMTISSVLEEAIKEFLKRQRARNGLKRLRKLPKVHIPQLNEITREDIYANRY